MAYFSVLSRDLKLELLQHFWITEINILSSKLGDFKLFRNDELFWREIYRTHFENISTFRELCLNKSQLIQDRYDSRLHGCYSILDSCLSLCMSKSIPYHIDLTNCMMVIRPFPGEDRSYVSPIPLMELATKNEIAMIKYLYDTNHLGKSTFLNCMYSHPAVFKYFVPSIVPLTTHDIFTVKELIDNTRRIGGHNLSPSDHERLREVESYLLSLYA